MNVYPFHTEPYLSRLREIAARYAIAIDVEAVPDIQAWCNEHGLAESNPFRSAKVVRNNQDGRFLVLVASPLTQAMVSSAIDAMSLRRHISGDEASLLADPLKFLCHLILHEVAHALDCQRSERDCDRWALEQMVAGTAI